MEQIAYGRLNLSENEFLNCFPRWFFIRLNGYQKDKLEQQESEWARTRWMTAAILNISGKQLRKDVKPEELIELSFDKQHAPQPSDIWTEDIIKQIEEIQRQDKLKNNVN